MFLRGFPVVSYDTSENGILLVLSMGIWMMGGTRIHNYLSYILYHTVNKKREEKKF